MRFGINALVVTPDRPGGDVTYALEVTRRLSQIPAAEWVIFVTAAGRDVLGEVRGNVQLVECRVPDAGPVGRALWEQIILPAVARRSRLDALFAPVNVLPIAYRGPMLLTVHEAEPFMAASGIPLPLLAWWRVVRRYSTKRARRILTVSETARSELVYWMGLSRDAIDVVHLGVDFDRFASGRRAASPLDGQPYILWVGRPYPRKHVDTLLDAFSRLRQLGRGEHLVLLGPPGWNESHLRQRIDREFERGVIHRLPPVWQALPAWYANASVFAFPSGHETFGLPVLEAMASDAAVVAGDIPALREVAGTAAMFVPPRDSEMLANAIHDVIENTELRSHLVSAGRIQASRFTWDACVHETYQQLRVVSGLTI